MHHSASMSQSIFLVSQLFISSALGCIKLTLLEIGFSPIYLLVFCCIFCFKCKGLNICNNNILLYLDTSTHVCIFLIWKSITFGNYMYDMDFIGAKHCNKPNVIYYAIDLICFLLSFVSEFPIKLSLPYLYVLSVDCYLFAFWYMRLVA